MKNFIIILIAVLLVPLSSWAATTIPFTITTSEAVNVTGTPRIQMDVGGVTRYAAYTSGTGTSSLTFTYTMVAGDVDLDGVTLTSPMQLNTGTIKDLHGNDATLTFTVPNTSNVKVNYPSLGMDFVEDADGRYTLNGTAYNDLPAFLTATGGTFTRASIGTYYDSAGTLQTAASGTPRFDYDPVTHTAKGILIEEQRTNLLTRSSEFDDAIWTKQFTTTVTANASQAPDGTMTADLVYPGTSGAPRSVYQAMSYNNVSIYAKASGINWIAFIDKTGSLGAAWFNLSNGTIGTVISGYTADIKIVGNGWYRCSITADSGNFPYAQFLLSDGNGSINATNSGTNGVLLWGVQAETGLFPTSYIPTTAAAVTRAADKIDIPSVTGLTTPPVTVYSEGNSFGYGSAVYPGFWHAGGIGGALLSYHEINNNVLAGRYNASPSYYAMLPVTFTANPIKSSVLINSTNISGSANGGAIGTNSSFTATLDGSLGVGRSVSNGGFLNGYLRKIKYYPSAISNTQLQLMTQ